MTDPVLISILRENHAEINRRWLEYCDGHIAEEFEQMLRTPMGNSVANSLFSLVIEYLEAEDYKAADVVHRLRECASDASFRRAAVGFSLPDIVATALAFRKAMQDTLIDNFNTSSLEEERELSSCLLELNRLGDALVSGDIAGFFAYSRFGNDEEDIAEAV